MAFKRPENRRTTEKNEQKRSGERREEKSKPSENESPKLAHRILNEATAAEWATRPSNFSEHDFFHLVLVLFSLSIDDFLVLPSNNLWKLCSWRDVGGSLRKETWRSDVGIVLSANGRSRSPIGSKVPRLMGKTTLFQSWFQTISSHVLSPCSKKLFSGLCRRLRSNAYWSESYPMIFQCMKWLIMSYKMKK